MQTVMTADTLLVNGFLLILLALIVGAALGVAATRLFGPRGVDGRDTVELMSGLFQWTSGMAQEMAEYRAAVRRMTENYADQASAAAVNGADPVETPANQLVAKILAANETLQQRLEEAEAALQEQSSEISSYANEARTDPLTHLDNRRAFDEQLNRRFAEWRRHETPLSIVLVDIDHFKSFNDTHGHLAGDEVLVGVARVMRQAMRESDIVARFGGEEFAMILPASDWEDAGQAALRIRRAVENAVLHYEDKPLGVTVSCGVAQATEADSVKQLIERADAALYASKEAGRNCAHLHDGNGCVPLNEPSTLDSPGALTERPPTERSIALAKPDARQSGRVKRSFDDVCRRLQERFRNVTR